MDQLNCQERALHTFATGESQCRDRGRGCATKAGRLIIVATLVVSVLSSYASAQWVHTNGPEGGDIRAFAVIGTNLLAGSNGGGVFLSTNDGATWTPDNTGLTNSNVGSLAISGTGIFAGTGGGAYLSTNSGASWTQTGLRGGSVTAFAGSGGNIFAGMNDSVFYSTDNGTSWSAASAGLTNGAVFALTVSGTNVFAGTRNGVYVSTNNGTNWNATNGGLTVTYVNALAFSGSNLFAGTYGGGVFLSTNNGASWSPVNNGLTNVYVEVLASSGANLFAGTDAGVFLSTDSGATWTAANNGLTYPIHALTLSGGNFFAGTPGGVFASTNAGANWAAVNAGLASAVVGCFASSGANVFAGTGGGLIFLSTNSGTNWAPLNPGLTISSVQALVFGGSNLFAGTNGSGVYVSTNNGGAWSRASTGLTFTDVFALCFSGTNLFAGVPGAGVSLSTNGGTNWTAVNTGLTNTQVYALCESGSNLFAGTWGGGVFLSTNSGTNWTPVNSGLSNTYILTLVASGTNLFAGTNGSGVYVSTNNGGSWSSANTGMSNTVVQAIAVSGVNLFAGTTAGVFFSTSSGASWTAVNNGLTNPNVLTLIASGTDLLAGTSGGAWTRPLADFLVPAPVVTTTAVSGISTTGATLNGTVNPNGSSTSYDFQYGTTTMYGTTTSVQNAGSGTSALAVNSPIGGLTPNTLYHYRLVGSNPGGITYGNDTTFTTLTPVATPPAVTTSAASNITTTGAILNGRVNPNGDSTSCYFQYGPTASYGTNSPTQYAGSGATALAVNSPAGSLTAGTSYHFRLVGANAGGTTYGNDTTLTTLPSAPTMNAAGSFTATGFTVSWAAVSGASNFRLGVSADNFATFTGPYRDTSIGLVTSYVVAGLNQGTLYYCRVTAENGTGASGISNVVTAVTYRTIYTVSDSVSFPALSSLTSYQSTDYQLIGIPGNSAKDISAFLKGNHREDWQVYWDNGKIGAPQDYFVEYQSGDQNFACKAGRAFWLLNRGSWILSDQVSTANLTNDGASIPLVAGWNLITNPFDSPVTWTDVVKLHPGLQGITAWVSGYVSAQELMPYRGYWFYNDSDYAALTLPYTLTTPSAGKLKPSVQEGWRISIVARSGKLQDATAMLGVSPDATTGMNSYEQRKPRYISPAPYLYFDRKVWDSKYPEFSTDIRSAVGEVEDWELLLRSNAGTPTTLEFTGLDQVPAGMAVYLADEGEGCYCDLRGQAVYTIPSAQQVTALKVLVGDPGKVKQMAEQVVPRQYALMQNYPNPFNPTTTIPLLIPKQSRATVEIYNILGQRIRLLYEGELPMGITHLLWDGTNDLGKLVSSGLYVCRFTSGGFNAYRKMILAK